MPETRSAELIRTEIHERVAIVTLTNERRKNSLTVAMVEEFIDALNEIEADQTMGAVIVTGAGDAFCAGADLRHLVGAAGPDEQAEESLRSIYAAFQRLHACPLPTIAAVNGPAVGAGMNLAMACDVILASEDALFATRFLELGLHPGGGHTWLLRQFVGAQVANALVLLGQDVDGARASEIGLALETVESDLLLERALELGAKACIAPRGVAERAKASIREAGGFADYASAIENEIPKQLWSAQQDDFQQRIAARMSPARP
ncbi:enoyl-CoA hydratase [Microbacterium aoyamense]|uniref:Enoyl-CoA hydratase n=1 Tax=Microbacterium aoyamense TaxID=344166 RepID=A0ABN2PB51_9MICO|nr:enoyl-CoA hydratase-related protein [Microbacterium aoyamense]